MLAAAWAQEDTLFVERLKNDPSGLEPPDYRPELRWTGSLELPFGRTDKADSTTSPIGRGIPVDPGNPAVGQYRFAIDASTGAPSTIVVPDDDPVWVAGGVYDLPWITRVHPRTAASSGQVISSIFLSKNRVIRICKHPQLTYSAAHQLRRPGYKLLPRLRK